MKKNIIALAVASAIAAPVAMADAPVVYGKLNLNVNAEDRVGDKGVTVDSVASRLGIKGSEDLGDGLKAVYKVEFALNEVADNASSSASDADDDGQIDSVKFGKGTISQRNAYLGLAGGFGTVLLGRHDTPTKMSQPSDLFNDGAADLGKLTNGLYNGETRAPDVLAYVSPSFSGVKIIAAAVMDEGSAPDAGDWVNIAATYGSTKKGLYLAAAWQDKTQKDADLTVMRLSAQYKTGGLIVNAMHQDNSGDDTDDGTFTHFQAGYKMGKFMPKIKYAMTDNEADDSQENALAVGLNYSLGKKTTAYIYATDKEDVGGINGTYLGMVHKF